MELRGESVSLVNIGGAYSAKGTDTFVAVEVKRNANIDAVEQLTRYLSYLDRDPLLNPPVVGMLAAQTITPQARTLASDRGILVKLVSYDELRGLDSPEERLF